MSNCPTVDLVVSFCNEPESTVERVRLPARTSCAPPRRRAPHLLQVRVAELVQPADNVGREGTRTCTISRSTTASSTSPSSTVASSRHAKGVRKVVQPEDSVFRQVLASHVGAGGERCRRRTATARTATTTRACMGNGGCTGTLALADGRAEALARGRRTASRAPRGVLPDVAAVQPVHPYAGGLWRQMRRRRLRVRRHWRHRAAGQAGAKHRDADASSPRSFPAWACHHWSVTPSSCSVQWQGPARCRRRAARSCARASYSDARDARSRRAWRASPATSRSGCGARSSSRRSAGSASWRRPTTIADARAHAEAHRLRHGRATARPGSGRRSSRPDAQPEYDVGRRRWSARSARSSSGAGRARRAAASSFTVNKKSRRWRTWAVHAHFNVTFGSMSASGCRR